MDKRATVIITLFPVLALILAFFIIPLCDSIQNSLHATSGEFVGIQQYIDVFSSDIFPRVMGNTLIISAVSTVIAITLATVFALALRGSFLGKKLSVFVVQLNSAFPHMSVAIMMVFMLSTWGFLSSLCYDMGWIRYYYEFPKIIRGDSLIGVIISFSWKFAPFIGLSVLSVLQTSSSDYEMQAATLGLGPVRRFIHVTLPSISPALFSTGIICFAYAFGSYEVPALLTNASTISMYAYTIFNEPVYSDMVNYSYVYCNIIMAVSIIAAVLYYVLAISKKKVTE